MAPGLEAGGNEERRSELEKEQAIAMHVPSFPPLALDVPFLI